MKTFLIVMVLMASLAQHSVFAHGSHNIDGHTAISIVQETVPKLTAKDFGFEVGQLDTSWKSIKRNDVSVVETDGDFYVMRATNSESKAVIYLLIGINGQVIQVKNNNEF